MSPSTSSRKRPALSSSIQPSITSFFSPTPPSNGPSNPSTTTTNNITPNSVTWRTGSSPNELPPSIKSGLLNVGMRVRKAVPEGLKSGTYKSTKFTLTIPSQEIALPQPKRNANKRGHQEYQQVEASMEAERPVGQIAMPKSLKRRYHTAVPRDTVGDTDMEDQCSEDGDFSEAGFLQPIA